MEKLNFKNQKGSLLIESIVAISVIVVGLLGVLGLLSRSLAVGNEVSQRFIAAYLAAEGVEVVKSLIDDNYANNDPWNSGLPDGEFELDFGSAALSGVSGNPLNFDSASGVYSSGAGSPTSFRRTVAILGFDRNNDGQTDEIKVNSKVTWFSRGNLANEVNLEDHFFDWR